MPALPRPRPRSIREEPAALGMLAGGVEGVGAGPPAHRPSWGIRRHLAQFTPKKQRRLPAPLSTGGWGLPWAPPETRILKRGQSGP